MTRIVLVRHGETAWNLERRIQGQRNSELSPAGMRQAYAVAAHLATMQADILVSSDLGRTMQTAAPIGAATGLDVRPHAGLRERSFGVFEGLTADEVERSWPAEYRRWQSRDASYAIPGGESLLQLRERVKTTLESIARGASGSVIVVTHGGFLDAAYRIARGIGAEIKRDWPLLNASLNTIEIHGQGWRLGDWGRVDHLGDALDDQE